MSIITSFRNGRAKVCDRGPGCAIPAQNPATAAIAKPRRRRTRPGTPLWLDRVTLAMSSAKPIAPKAAVTNSTIQT